LTAWLVALAPLLGALLVYAGLAVPLRARAGEARDGYGQARRLRQQAQGELASLERRAAAWRRAAAAAAAGKGQREPAALRRAVLAALEGSGATAVRLGLRPGPRGASVRVSAIAPYAQAVGLAGELARPGAGLILTRVQFRPRTDRKQVTLDVEALAPHVRP
jgi:hypothetical protein